MKTLKQRMHAREQLAGTHVELNDACITEICALAGFDFIWIDTEHSSIDRKTLLYHLIAAKAGGAETLVRVPWNDKVLVKHVLEMGPTGVIIPMVDTREEADYAMRSLMYPPKGVRGFGPIRAVKYGLESMDDYIARIDETLCRCIQLESRKAVENLREIVKNPYIDAYIFGPCDMSGSIGELGRVFDEHTTQMIDEAIHILREEGKTIGVSTGANDMETLAYWHDKGVNMISTGADYSYIASQARVTHQNIFKVQGREA